MIALTTMVMPIHAASLNTSGDGYNITFTITSTSVSGTITGKYSSGASVEVHARYKNVDGDLSSIQIRTGSPYTSIYLSEMPRINGKANKSWTGGKAKAKPTSLTYWVSTTWLEL